MSKLSALFVLSCLLALAAAEPRLQAQLRAIAGGAQRMSVPPHPYVFFSVPRGRANAGAVVHGFQLVEHEDDDDDVDDAPVNKLNALHNEQLNAADDNDNDDDDDDDDDNEDADNAQDDIDNDDDIDMAHQRPLSVGLGFSRNGQLVLLKDAGRHHAQSANDNDDDDQDDQDDDDDDDAADESQHIDANAAAVNIPVLLAKNGQRLPLTERLTRTALHNAGNAQMQQVQQVLKTAKPTHMMVARDQAGALMVPDGIIEIEGQSVVDEKTGKAALLVPRSALDAIPDGSVVALMERSAAARDEDALEEERANRVIVRRRRKGARRDIRRRRPNTAQRRRGTGQRRRRGNSNRRKNVRVVRPSNNNNNRRRTGNMRRRRGGSAAAGRPIVLQG